MSVINRQYLNFCFEWGLCTPSWFGVGIDIRRSEWWRVTGFLRFPSLSPSNFCPSCLYTLAKLKFKYYPNLSHWSDTAEWNATGHRESVTHLRLVPTSSPLDLYMLFTILSFCIKRPGNRNYYQYKEVFEEDTTPSVRVLWHGSPQACPNWIYI